MHCEPEMDLMHRLQSIHITLLSKNTTPDETEQLTSSCPSQCRVLPARQELPAERLVLTAWAPYPSAPTESLTPVMQDGFGEMSSHECCHNTRTCFPPAFCSSTLPQAVAQEQSRSRAAAVPARNMESWPQLQRSWCVPEVEAYFILF